MPDNLHDAVGYIIWTVLIVAAGFVAIPALFDRQFKKAAASFSLMSALVVSALYWPQIIAALPGWKLIGIGSAGTFIILISIELFSLRNDFNLLVLPRKLTTKQTKAMQDHLAKCSPAPITISVNSVDQEARDYAGQIVSVLQRAQWKVDFNTAENNHASRVVGLYIQEDGIYAKIRDPRNDPAANISNALREAKVLGIGGGSVTGGIYKLSLIVGRRPLRLKQSPGILFKLANWINQIGRKLHK